MSGPVPSSISYSSSVALSHAQVHEKSQTQTPSSPTPPQNIAQKTSTLAFQKLMEEVNAKMAEMHTTLQELSSKVNGFVVYTDTKEGQNKVADRASIILADVKVTVECAMGNLRDTAIGVLKKREYIPHPLAGEWIPYKTKVI